MDRRDLFNTELSFISPDLQAQSSQFAASIANRIARLASPAPLVTVHTYVKDGEIIERDCAASACGVWGRTGTSHRRCAGCMLVYYCCKECQLAHWRAHKAVCV